MKKQIIYPDFIPRLFATTIDLFILFLVLSPIINFISKYAFLYIFHDFFVQNNVDTSNIDAIMVAIRMQEFAGYITAQKFFTYFMFLLVINTILMAAYFIIFWHKFGTTLGKMVMRMKIVDADSYSGLTLYQCIKRFVGYVTSLLGVWYILFNKRGMALHDKIANTVVIKS
ncbi:RDD family protein [Rickettsiaceae bacterium]|nr:RDD family protein [Rickettsiaceae bacterium]